MVDVSRVFQKPAGHEAVAEKETEIKQVQPV